jgi:hypothetical protein
MASDLRRSGYPSLVIESKKSAYLGGMCSHDEFETIPAKRKYWEECHLNFMS